MTELEPQQQRALHDALAVSVGPPPTAAITTRGTTLRRRRRAAAALASAGLAVAGVLGFAVVGGSGRPATLGVVSPPESSPPASTPAPLNRGFPRQSPNAAPCPVPASPANPLAGLIDPRDHARTPAAARFNSHAIQTAQAMDAVAAKLRDRSYAIAEADGAKDDIIVWRVGGAAGASPAYGAAALPFGIPVVFRAALLSKGQIEATEGAMVRAAAAFAAAGVTWKSAGSDGHGIVTVGIDPLTDAGRAVADARAPYGAKSIIVVCDQGAVL